MKNEKQISLKYNERAWAIDLISFINSKIKQNSFINKASGELSLSGEATPLFPDVLLFGGKASGSILQGWELKMPDTPIDDEDLLANAEEKARRLNLNSYLVWNAVEVRLYIKNENEFHLANGFQILKTAYKKRQDVSARPDLWQKQAIEILKKLNRFFELGYLHDVSAAAVFSDEGLIGFVLSAQQEVVSFLKLATRKNSKIEAKIKLWWMCVRNEYPGYDSPYEPLAFVITLKWFNRFVFSNILYAYRKIEKEEITFTYDASINDVIELFTKISHRIDYWNILGPSEFDENLPDSVWKSMLSVNHLLNEYNFSQIDKKILTEILSSTVLTSIKKGAGQFATPQNVAELLVRLTLQNKESSAIDPFCGTGTIVKNILDVKREYDINERDVIQKTWACDKFAFPVQIATLAVASPNNINESLQIFTHDAITLREAEPIKFIDPVDGKIFSRNLPKFDAIISNLPFVEFELLKELNPEVFDKINNFYKKMGIAEKEKLDGKSDLYCYLPFLLYFLMKDKGFLGIVISNSWLSTKAGKKFYDLLKRTFNVNYIITSANGRWFPQAEVVTNILILQKKVKENKSSITSFISLDVDVNEEKNIKELVYQILCDNYSTFNKFNREKYNAEEIEFIEQKGLGLNACFGDCNWLIKNIDKFKPLSQFASVSRGERRGWDPLFFPDSDECKSIEKQYLKNVYKTAKGSLTYEIEPDSKAFCCNKSESALKELGHQGALKWIKIFANKKNGKGLPLPQVLKRNGLYWYEMPTNSQALLAMSMNPDKKICIYKFNELTFVNQRLISIRPNKNVDTELLHALINSIYCTSQIEAIGFGRGAGVLDINATRIKEALYIPDMDLISAKDKKEILSLFEKIKKEKILDTIKSLDDTNWNKFNDKIAAALLLPTGFRLAASCYFKRLYSIRKYCKK